MLVTVEFMYYKRNKNKQELQNQEQQFINSSFYMKKNLYFAGSEPVRLPGCFLIDYTICTLHSIRMNPAENCYYSCFKLHRAELISDLALQTPV